MWRYPLTTCLYMVRAGAQPVYQRCRLFGSAPQSVGSPLCFCAVQTSLLEGFHGFFRFGLVFVLLCFPLINPIIRTETFVSDKHLWHCRVLFAFLTTKISLYKCEWFINNSLWTIPSKRMGSCKCLLQQDRPGSFGLIFPSCTSFFKGSILAHFI